MAHARATSADILLVNNAEEEIGPVVKLQTMFPEIRIFPAQPVTKTVFKTLDITAYPAAAFRAVNAGRDTTKPTLANQTVTCKFLDASWDIDVAAVKESEWGEDATKDIYKMAAWRGALTTLCSQTWYGTDNDANGFAGIASLYPNNDSTNVIDAGGSGSDLSSAYLLHLGTQAFCYAWGNDATLEVGELVKTLIPTSTDNTLWGWAQSIGAWCAICLTNNLAGVRICNLENASTKCLTDTLVAEALSKFHVGMKPDVLFCNRHQHHRLQSSRTATNPTGAPAPFPTESHGIPIEVTESLVQTEDALTAAAT